MVRYAIICMALFGCALTISGIIPIDRQAAQAGLGSITSRIEQLMDKSVVKINNRGSRDMAMRRSSPFYPPDVNLAAEAADPGWKREFQVDINPTSAISQYAIAVSNYSPYVANSNYGVYYYYTRDGGQSWMAIKMPPPPNVQHIRGDPEIAYDNNGYAYMVYLVTDTSPYSGWVQRTEDNGQTWSTPVSIAPEVSDRPNITVDRGGSSPRQGWIYVTYQLNISTDGTSNQIYGVYSNDKGATWSTPFKVGDAPPPNGTEQAPVPIVASDGTIYVGYQQYQDYHDLCANGVQNVVMRAKSFTAWPPYVPVFDQKTVLNITQGGACNPPSITVRRAKFCFDSAGDSFKSASSPILSVDPTDPKTVYMVYSGGDIEKIYPFGVYICGPNNIFVGYHSDTLFRKSTDGGATWTNPMRINGDGFGKDQYMPWMDVAPNGKIWVGWNDRREDPNNWRSYWYQAYSTNKGDTWTEYRVADENSQSEPHGFYFIGDYHGLAARNDLVLGVWFDSRTHDTGDPFTHPGP
jgi:hypothetical protein